MLSFGPFIYPTACPTSVARSVTALEEKGRAGIWFLLPFLCKHPQAPSPSADFRRLQVHTLSFTEVFTILPSVSWVLGIFPSLNCVNNIHIKANRYNEYAECKSISTSIYMKVHEKFSTSPHMAPTSSNISSSTFKDCMTEDKNTSCNYYYWNKKLSTILSVHQSTSSTWILVFIVGRKCFSPQIFT